MAYTIQLVDGVYCVTTNNDGVPVTSIAGANLGSMIAANANIQRQDKAALATHNHDTAYAALEHNHDTSYASIGHNHTGVYSPVSHNHNTAYSAIEHNHNAVYAQKPTSLGAIENGKALTLDLNGGLGGNAEPITTISYTIAPGVGPYEARITVTNAKPPSMFIAVISDGSVIPSIAEPNTLALPSEPIPLGVNTYLFYNSDMQFDIVITDSNRRDWQIYLHTIGQIGKTVIFVTEQNYNYSE